MYGGSKYARNPEVPANGGDGFRFRTRAVREIDGDELCNHSERDVRDANGRAIAVVRAAKVLRQCAKAMIRRAYRTPAYCEKAGDWKSSWSERPSARAWSRLGPKILICRTCVSRPF